MIDSERIKEVRKLLNLSQVEFANKLGVTQSSISAIESGGGVSSEVITAIIKEFKVNSDWLLFGRGNAFSNIAYSQVNNYQPILNGHHGITLKNLIKESGFVQSDFADKMGISRNYLLTLLDKSSLKSKYIDKACEILNVNKNVFTMSIHSGFVQEPHARYGLNKNLSQRSDLVGLKPGINRKNNVPIYNADFTEYSVSDIAIFQDHIIGYIDIEGFNKCIGFIRVTIDCMSNAINPGDLVGLEPEPDLKTIEYGHVYQIITKTGKKLMRIIRKGKDDDNLILRASNKEYDEINLEKNQIHKLFKVHGPIRDTWQ